MTKIRQSTTKGITENSIFLSLSVVTFYYFIAYFPLIPSLGFYSEDIFVDYVWHFFGTNGIFLLTSIDRPSHGYLLNILFNFLGDNILFWHVYTFCIRLLGGYFLFFLLNKIWSKRIPFITTITLIFLTYPGFLQQSLPLGYGIWLSTLTFWILSLLLTVHALFAAKNEEKFKFIFLFILSLIFQGISLLLLEFFIGLEIIRIFLIFYILNSEEIISFFPISSFFKKILFHIKYYMPYITIVLIFLFWRFFIFKSSRDITDINYVTQTFYSDPIWIAKIPIELIHSFLQTVVFAYFIPFTINFIRIPLENSLVSIVTGFSAGSFIYLYLKNNENTNLPQAKLFGKQLLIIGIVTITSALIPIILAGRFVRVYLVYDRYTISSMIGVGLFLTGLFFYLAKPKIRNIIFATILSISISSMLMNGFYRVHNWEKQKEIWWQLYWRSPQIKDNAMLIFFFPESIEQNLFKNIINKVQFYRIYWVIYQISSTGNLFFNYHASSDNHFNGDFLSDKGILQKIQNQTFETKNDSNLIYKRYFGNSVILTAPGDNSCLWVLDKNRGELPEFSNELLSSSIIYSDTSKLVRENSSAEPPSIMFGKEPEKNWCYYFEKANLARQENNFALLSHLTNEIMDRGFRPEDINEWLPFIEGFVDSKRNSQTKNLLNWISQNYPPSAIFNNNLCNMSKRLESNILKSYCN